MGKLLTDYLDGHQVRVWTELTSMGTDLRGTDGWSEAVEVARATMRRVRTNVERLAELLPATGYRFTEPTDVFSPPPPDIAEQLTKLEGQVGPIPLALRCWYEEVGRVDLTGGHPDWELELTDALVVDAPIEFVLDDRADWESDRGTEWDRGTFTIDFAPDLRHKAGISGGPPYSLAVPNPGVDGLVLWEPHQTTFVNYLRTSFRFGGFPGWEGHTVPEVIRELAGKLLPI
ncbi:hypothetical protein GCM10010174_78510 [Kutzneria viridogrisea]|uniref:Uncharacterized protein n=2 Tax=Kutzneria TaxID=43356 RepID=W5W416_9PSEU|nr:hypothetical protein [Kutzneria albida]AHH95587.1 hypothetical protein KALB_2218 [Kutzneria albida DSM 43870]MBA8927051.1 hypothetical protein [Kutzneria viridogrisea]